MAEIKIEKKKPWWPWAIVLLIILAVLAYFFLTSDNEMVDDDVIIEPEEEMGALMENDHNELDLASPYSKSDLEVAEYTSFIGDKSKLGTDVKYTKDALVQLSNAVRYTALENGMPSNKKLENLKTTTAHIQKDGDEVRLAQRIKNVGVDIAEIINELQQKNFPRLAVKSANVKSAVAAIVPTREVEEQQDKIIGFFDACGNILKEMNSKK